MKKFLLTLWLVPFCLFSSEKAFVVVIPSYNNADWYQKNLDSVLNQKYKNFRLVYIDDASPDGTGKLVEEYIKKRRAEKKVTLVRNSKRIGALGNVYKGVWLCRPKEIVAVLDGDDWFAHDRVLEKLNSVYADPDVWATYGQFEYWPSGDPGWAAQVADDIIASNGFRDVSWTTTALRTFYAGIFHKIKKKDLYYEGNFYQMTGDLAYMWPIVEMAGFHSRFIPDVLYIYNVSTPLNDEKLDREKQFNLGLHMRNLERYTPLRSPY